MYILVLIVNLVCILAVLLKGPRVRVLAEKQRGSDECFVGSRQPSKTFLLIASVWLLLVIIRTPGKVVKLVEVNEDIGSVWLEVLMLMTIPPLIAVVLRSAVASFRK